MDRVSTTFTRPSFHSPIRTFGNCRVTFHTRRSAAPPKPSNTQHPFMTQTGTNNIGALVGVLNLDNVFASAARGLETKSSQLMVMAVDRSGKIIYHSNRSLKDLPANQAMPGFNSIANAMKNNEGGVREFKSPAGSYLTAYSPIPQLNVAVAVARDRSASLSSAHRWGIAGLVLALLSAAGGAFLLERHVQRRSRGIAQVSEDVSAIAKGELDRRIILESSDDYRSLADNINVVTDQLRAQIAREEETRQFQSFMRLSAMLTHDLKNAIEGLSLTVGNMERHFDNPQFRADALKGLTGATNKLKALVARLSRPMTSLSGEHKRPTDVDLVPIIQRVVAMTAEPVRSKHSIVTRLPPTLHALADAARVEEVLENLVLNALEAMTDKGGTLTIEAGQTSERRADVLRQRHWTRNESTVHRDSTLSSIRHDKENGDRSRTVHLPGSDQSEWRHDRSRFSRRRWNHISRRATIDSTRQA